MEYDNKWIQEIVDLQQADGSWGCFHTLSKPAKGKALTTEQALRRLYQLGLTDKDKPIQKALTYMKAVLRHELTPPDRREKVLNWDFFESMMMATWIRRYSPQDKDAAIIAAFWADIIRAAFSSGIYDDASYEAAYREKIPKLHNGERLIDISQFYMVNLLWGELDRHVESAFVDSIIHHANGIYYVYDQPIRDLPDKFDSLQASRYIGALECMAAYSCASEKLSFAIAWLHRHKQEDTWDLGPEAKDNVYFPVSNSWRKSKDRKLDCTVRIRRLLNTIAV